MTVAPERIREYSDQTVEYVRRALGVAPAYDSDTLPLLDHYLRSVPAQQTATAHLVLATAAAYFGETVIHHIGGRWEGSGDDATTWRVVLPSGLSSGKEKKEIPASVAKKRRTSLSMALEKSYF